MRSGEKSRRLQIEERTILDQESRRVGGVNPRRRISIERLAIYHLAAVGRGSEALLARFSVTAEDLAGLSFGETFAETLLLCSPLLDLYEEKPFIRRLQAVAGGDVR